MSDHGNEPNGTRKSGALRLYIVDLPVAVIVSQNHSTTAPKCFWEEAAQCRVICAPISDFSQTGLLSSINSPACQSLFPCLWPEPALSKGGRSLRVTYTSGISAASRVLRRD